MDIAVVDKKGIVTGVEPGEVTITVKSKKDKNYKSGSTTVTIKVLP